MEDFLKNHCLENLLEIFRANDVTLEIANKLTREELKELIPSIGQRKLFIEALANRFSFDEPESVAELVEYEIGEDNCLVNVTNHQLTQTKTSGVWIDDGEQASTSSAASSDTTGSYVQIPALHRDVSFCGIENAFTPIVLPGFDLKTLLETTPLGNTILSYYQKNNYLNNSKRSLLVDIIIKKIFNFIITHRLTHSDYNILTAKIMTLFPKECGGTYYVPAISKKNSVTNRPVIAKGKLVDKVRNLLRVNREMLQSYKKTGKEKVERSYDEELKNVKIWLNTRNDPWSEVIEKWQKTFDMRRSCDLGTMDTFLNEWKILKDSRSSTLIDIDFDRMYPESSISIHIKWYEFMEKLINLKKETVKDKVACPYFFELLEDTDCSEDTIVAVHLHLLPYLIPPKSRTKITTKKHWKFSAAEVLESLLMHVKVPGDIQESICNYRDKMYHMNQTVQPYILIEGPSLQNIRSVYVVVDTIQFKCETVLKALDFNFKLFHVANACYPKQSEYLWMLIQNCIYRITTVHDKVIPYILDIIETINNN